MKYESLEETISDFFYNLFIKTLLQKITPDFTVSEVTELTEEYIDFLINQYNIKGVILDVDETIRYSGNSITLKNQEWLKLLKSKLKIIVVSNGIDANIKKFFNDMGIDYIGFAIKPLKKNFIESCKRLKLDPSNVIVIGDDLIADIYGGNRNNMKTVMVFDKHKKR